ncbi:MAG: DUF2796 domain-containing protein [Hyphomicrobiaceae bacterium]
MKMCFPGLAILCWTALAMPAFGADGHRHAKAHQHGHGTANIAIEKNRIDIELVVPGADIVGFEHAPKSQEQKDNLAEAKKKLADILSLMKVSQSAQCNVSDVKIEFGAPGSEDHKGHKGHDDHDDHGHSKEASKHDDHDDHKGEHGEFHASYVLKCEDVSQVKALSFAYFKVFASAQELDVNIVTAKKQSKFEVTRDKPDVTLDGAN